MGVGEVWMRRKSGNCENGYPGVLGMGLMIAVEHLPLGATEGILFMDVVGKLRWS